MSCSFQIRTYSKSISGKLLNVLNKMPKEQKHIAEAQRQRKRIKEKSSKYSPGRVTLQVLGTGAHGAPKSLYIFSDQSRYLFNCGEGTQRLAHEHKMKLAKLEHIFITEPVWRNFGGLPGAALTIQDVGVPEIILHGPPGLGELFVATRRFVVLKDLEIRVADCSPDASFEDNVLKVKYVPITKKNNKTSGSNGENHEIPEDNTDYYAHEHSGKRKQPEHLQTNSKLFQQGPSGISMAYICQLQPRPGALCLDKCVKFGVPAGPLLGQLKSGQDIVLPNGKTVRAADVCDPDDPGPVFIVVDCPNEDYLDSLVSNDIFREYQSSATNDDKLAYTVVHFSPNSILINPKYREWVNLFSPSTHHVVLNETNRCMGSAAVHRIQYKLNLLTSDIFPLLGDRGTEIDAKDAVNSPPEAKKIKTELSIESLSVDPPQSDDYIFASTLYSHHLRPKKGSDRLNELKLTPNEFLNETLMIEGFQEVLNETREKILAKKSGMEIGNYPNLLFLGTGSSIPNKTRNTSGILLEIDEQTVIIMDCGEGTYGQIVRFYGPSKAKEILRRIKAIYISHLHADHHLGLIGLLQGRREALKGIESEEKSPVYLLAPKQIMWWLNFYHKCFEEIQQEFEIIANSDLLMDNHELSEDVKNELFDRLGMSDINTCYVKHCPNAFGVSFSDKMGHKITYSGDTMPTESLVELGMNSNLLIHEATMEDELANEAVIKMHSTTSQAIEIGKKMNANYILLTHFSQRYAKLPRFNENFSDNIGIAFDNMQVKLDELPLLPLLYPALKLMFAEHYEELEHKAAKRQMKLEREALNAS